MLLGPLDAGTGHHGWETLLVDADGVFDERKINEGDLEDVKRKVALENAGPKFVAVSWLFSKTEKAVAGTYRIRLVMTSDLALR